MKKLSMAIGIFLIAFLSLWNMNSCSPASRDVFVQEGKIASIDPVLHKMYVEIRLGEGHYIIMGEVNSNTTFLKDGHRARLSDFSEGEAVIVQWKGTKDGQVIKLIEAKPHAFKYGRLGDGSHLMPK